MATIAVVSAGARYPELSRSSAATCIRTGPMTRTAEEAVEQAIAEAAPSQLPVIAAQIDDLLASHPADEELRARAFQKAPGHRLLPWRIYACWVRQAFAETG